MTAIKGGVAALSSPIFRKCFDLARTLPLGEPIKLTPEEDLTLCQDCTPSRQHLVVIRAGVICEIFGRRIEVVG